MPLDASAVAKLLHEFGQRTALRGGEPYRARAYSRAAENLLALTMPLEQIVAEDRLRESLGVGAAIADIIAKLHKTGTHAGLEAMRKDIPVGVLELLSVPGVRPEKVLKLYSELGIASLEGLEQAARQDRLKTVKGLGAALQSKILQRQKARRGPTPSASRRGDVSETLAPLDLDGYALDGALRKVLKLSERWLAMPPVELKSLVQEIAGLEGQLSQANALTPSRLLRLSKNLPHDSKDQRCFLGFAA